MAFIEIFHKYMEKEYFTENFCCVMVFVYKSIK